MRRIGTGRAAWAVVAVSAALFGGGCQGGDDEEAGGGGVTLETYGGIVVLAAGPDGATAYGAFFSRYEPFEPVLIPGATDTCVQGTLEGGDDGDDADFTYLDVGSEMTAASGTVDVDAARSNDFGLLYIGTSDETFPWDADYVVSISGSAAADRGPIGTVRVPAPAELEGAPEVVPGEPLALAFTRHVGADWIDVVVTSDDEETIWSCRSKDDGSFTLPADVTESVGAGASIELIPNAHARGEVAGRDVYLFARPYEG